MLNIYILFDELAVNNAEVITTNDHLPLTLVGVRMLPGNHNDLTDRYIYIVTDHELKSSIPDKQYLNMIYIGEQRDPGFFTKTEWQVILLPNIFDVQYIFESVLNIFEKYLSWNQDILSLIATNKLLQTVLDMGIKYLNNPVAVFDNSMALIAMAGKLPPNIESTPWEEITSKGYIEGIGFSIEKQKLMSQNLQCSEYPFLFYPDDHDKNNVHMAAGLFLDNYQIGAICSTNINAPITKGQLALFSILKSHTETLLRKNSHHRALSDGIDHYIDMLLQGFQIDEVAVAYYLSRRKWKIDDNFCILFFCQRDKAEFDFLERESLTFRIGKVLADTYVSSYEYGILAVVHNYEKVEKGNQFYEKLEHLAGNSNLICGISMELNDYMCINYAFTQAKMALQEKYLQPDKAIYHFSDHYTEHIMSSIDVSNSFKSLCHPKILRVFNRDKAQGRELIHTLYTFLTNGRNLSATAKSLHLHRNTLLYRIERYSELLQIDFNDARESEMFIILVTCKFLYHCLN